LVTLLFFGKWFFNRSVKSKFILANIDGIKNSKIWVLNVNSIQPISFKLGINTYTYVPISSLKLLKKMSYQLLIH